MNNFSVDIWRRAIALKKKADEEGESLGRQKLMELLDITEPLARCIVFALTYRDILNCSSTSYPVETDTTELLFGDVHIPFQNKASVEVMLDYAKEIKPDIISIMGDLQDCYQISTFNTNPIRGKRLFDEIKEGRNFLYKLREMFPEARIIFYRGNHEERIERYIFDRAPQLAELVAGLLIDKLELKQLNIEYITELFAIGKLWHLHGHEKPSGSYNPEYICNVFSQYIGDHFVVFHFHRTQSKTFKRIGNRFWNTYSVGCLCGDLDYARLNKWQNGFGVARYDSEGNFTFDNKTILNGVIY